MSSVVLLVELASAAFVSAEVEAVVVGDAPLDEVASEMARRRVGSAVVVAGTSVVGVFTAVDALRALADALKLAA